MKMICCSSDQSHFNLALISLQLLPQETNRFDTSMVGRRHDSVVELGVEFGHTRVAKRRHPPKNQESDSVPKTVLNVDMASLLKKIA